MEEKLRSTITELEMVSFSVKKSDAEKKEERPSAVTGAETSEATKKLGW